MQVLRIVIASWRRGAEAIKDEREIADSVSKETGARFKSKEKGMVCSAGSNSGIGEMFF